MLCCKKIFKKIKIERLSKDVETKKINCAMCINVFEIWKMMMRSICRKQTELTSRRCLWAEKRACAGPDGQFVRCSSMTLFCCFFHSLFNFLRESNCFTIVIFVICLFYIVMKCDNILFSTVFQILFP